MLRTAVLLVNLGTPLSAEDKDVYRYLNEFLTDGRVIDVPWLWRQLLVRGLIVPRRYRQSASSYRVIWTEEGSPLLVWGQRLQNKLQRALGASYKVVLAMRYQEPSLEKILQQLHEEHLDRLIILPLFPQYASATTGSVHQKVMQLVSQWTVIPETLFINSYATHPQLIEAFAEQARQSALESYDHIIFSFHGLPQKHLLKADKTGCCLAKKDCCEELSAANAHCYSAQCYATGHAIAKALDLEPQRYTISFQSRLGKDPWMEPYTSELIAKLAKSGAKRVLVCCPAFVADCLETLYEICYEYREEFQKDGGHALDLVPGLNDSDAFVATLASLVQERTSVKAMPLSCALT